MHGDVGPNQVYQRSRRCGFTCVVQDSSPCPVLDNHGEWANSWVNRHICLDHFGVQQSKMRINVHVAREEPIEVEGGNITS